MGDLDGLLHALEERASTARTIFMLLDSDADGLVAVEQVRPRQESGLPRLISTLAAPFQACLALAIRPFARSPLVVTGLLRTFWAWAPCRRVSRPLGANQDTHLFSHVKPPSVALCISASGPSYAARLHADVHATVTKSQL